MRDDTKLDRYVYLPEGDGPWPVIFLRFTPTTKSACARTVKRPPNKATLLWHRTLEGGSLPKARNPPFEADGQADGQWDGFDSATWIAQQPWCNGRIGTLGHVQSTPQGILIKPVTRSYIKSLRGSLKGRGVMKSMMTDRKHERDL